MAGGTFTDTRAGNDTVALLFKKVEQLITQVNALQADARAMAAHVDHTAAPATTQVASLTAANSAISSATSELE